MGMSSLPTHSVSNHNDPLHAGLPQGGEVSGKNSFEVPFFFFGKRTIYITLHYIIANQYSQTQKNDEILPKSVLTKRRLFI